MITIEYTIDSTVCSAAKLFALLKDGEIVSGVGNNNKKYYDRSTSELLENADLVGNEQIKVVGYDDDTGCELRLVVKYPLLNELDIAPCITAMEKSGILLYWEKRAIP